MMKPLLTVIFACIVTACHSQHIYETENGAINGYDPVAYFTVSQAVKGNEAHSLKWKGATWYFSSAENLNAFRGNPEKYAPAYGGFCAYGVAGGYKVKIEPDAWAIVDGKLYLNYDQGVQRKWNKDREGYIKKANQNWTDLATEEN